MVLMPDIEDSGSFETTPQLMGWVDVGDIVQALLTYLSSKNEEMPSAMLALMTALEKEGPAFASKPLITITDGGDRGLVFLGDCENVSIMTAIREAFIQYKNERRHINHRIGLFDAHGEVTHVISQMDVVKWIVSQNAQDERLSKSLTELGLMTGKPPVVSVNAHTPTLVAYGTMSSSGVSGAPVVTDAGEIIANLSTSDVRALTSEHFGILALPVAEFLALEHHTAYIGYSVSSSSHSGHPFFASSPRKGRQPRKGDIQVFAVNKETTLGEAMTKFVENHIHRVYVINDERGFPVVESVLTLTDVLQFLAGVW